jgi:hypothetical protein
MHKLYGGKSLKTKNARSATPEGFAYGFFLANNALHHPAFALTTKYDRLDPDLLEEALAVGASERDISDIIDDLYYIELDDDGANQVLREIIADRAPAIAA